MRLGRCAWRAFPGLMLSMLLAGPPAPAQTCNASWDTSNAPNGSTISPIDLILQHFTLKIFSNNILVATYNFDLDGYRWEITMDGIPYTDNPIDNPTGEYNTGKALQIANSLCPGFTFVHNDGNVVKQTSTVTIPASGQAGNQYVSADFNGDGIPDTAAAGSGFLQVTLYDQSGGTLASERYTTGGAYTGHVVTGDFNGDGIPDLAVSVWSNSPPGNVAVLIGKGDGTFANPQMYPVGSSPLMQAAVDMNGDGKTDLVVSDFGVSGDGPGSVNVLLGKGDGTFNAPVSYSAGLIPVSMIAADLNGDGRKDIAAIDAGTGSDKILVFLGQADGTLGPASAGQATGTSLGALAFTDLNHDGKTDLVIADERGNDFTVLMGNGDGTFQTPAPYVAAAQSGSAGIIPLGDGNTAIFTGDHITGHLHLVFAAPDGTIGSEPIRPVGTNLTAAALGDLNGDGRNDIVLTDQGGNRVFAVLNTGANGMANPVPYTVSSSPAATAIADVTGDGKPDLVVADNSGIEVLTGKGDGTFGTLQTTVVAGASAGVIGLAMADFDRDGKPDVALMAGGQVGIYMGKGDGTFTARAGVALTGTVYPVAILTADFDGDGRPDLAAGYNLMTSTTTVIGEVMILLGNGDGSFRNFTTIMLPGTVSSLAAGDVNKDGRPDLVAGVLQSTGEQIAVLTGKGDGGFQAPVLNATGTFAPSIVVADLNGDGDPDLVIGDCCGLSEASYMLGNGDGTFQAEFPFPSGPDPGHIVVGDLNGDGKPDLAIAGNWHGHGTLVTFLNNFATVSAAAVVSSADPYATGIAPGSLATAYGNDLATANAGSTTDPRPTSYGGTTVSIIDSTGQTVAAPLVYVSQGQVNFLTPATVAIGPATVTVTSGDGSQSVAHVPVSAVAPGIFTLNTSNLAAAVGIQVAPGGSQTPEQVYNVDSSGAIVAAPLSLGPADGQFILVLFGTGLQAAGTSGVTVTVNGVKVPVQYAGPQGTFDGLDQINVVLPPSLAGKGKVSIQVTAAGIAANTTNVTIQ